MVQRLGEGRLHELEAGLRMGTKRLHTWRDGGMGTRCTMSSVRGMGGYINVGIGGFINVRMGGFINVHIGGFINVGIGGFINAGIG